MTHQITLEVADTVASHPSAISPRLVHPTWPSWQPTPAGHRRGSVAQVSRVLIIEDDPAIRRPLVKVLEGRGHSVAWAGTGFDGISQVATDEPDVVLLDLGLPDITGQDVLRMLRALSDLPVIVITAQDDEASVVEALNAGADDYVVKPFGGDALDARIRAVLRRAARADETAHEVRVADLMVDERTRQATLGGRPLELSRKEFDLLWLLASHAGEVVTRRDLLAQVWQEPFGGSERTVDVHLSWLRRKLGETAAAPRYLHTVRGVGVRLVDPAEG